MDLICKCYKDGLSLQNEIIAYNVEIAHLETNVAVLKLIKGRLQERCVCKRIIDYELICICLFLFVRVHILTPSLSPTVLYTRTEQGLWYDAGCFNRSEMVRTCTAEGPNLPL